MIDYQNRALMINGVVINIRKVFPFEALALYKMWVVFIRRWLLWYFPDQYVIEKNSYPKQKPHFGICLGIWYIGKKNTIKRFMRKMLPTICRISVMAILDVIKIYYYF